MHPADEIRGILSNKLSHKRIILGITGSIAAVESVRLARELLRHGADVYPVMTKASTRIIHPDALEFATSHKPVIELTGQTEHVLFCGLVKKPADLLLIAPCTANTLSKIAHGIDDTSVTTFASTAIGSKIPIMMVPAMHLSMYHHPIVQENIKKCTKAGITIIPPLISGKKAKIPEVTDIVWSVIRVLGSQNLQGRNVLIIGGATGEHIDDIRILTNRSSGKTAIALAKNAFEQGANIELWYGYGQEPVPSFIPTTRFETLADLMKLVKMNIKKYDNIIVCAALANYLPKTQKGKISSGKTKLTLEFSPAPILLDKIRKLAPKVNIIAFKVEQKKEVVQKKGYELLVKNKLDAVIGNTIDAFQKDTNDISIITKKQEIIHKKGKKEDLAKDILELIT